MRNPRYEPFPEVLRVLSRLLRARLRPYRRAVALVVLLDLVQVAATLVAPGLNAAIVDDGVADGDGGYLLWAGALLLLAGLVQAAAAVGALSLGAGTAAALGRDLRAEIPGFAGAARTRDDVRQVQAMALTVLVVGVAAPVLGVGSAALALRRGFAAWAAPAVQGTAVAGTMAALVAGAAVAGAVLVRGGSPGRLTAPGQCDVDLFGLSVRVGRLTAMVFPAVLLTTNVLATALLLAGGDIRPGDLVALVGYLELTLVSVMLATAALATAPYARAAARRIQVHALRPPCRAARRSAAESRPGDG
jgi:ATP-binding cassette subfamily B protein